jgi:serine/threonine protein kinase
MAEQQESRAVEGSDNSSRGDVFAAGQIPGVDFVSPLRTQSGEADVWLARDQTGSKIVVKIYRHGRLPGLLDSTHKCSLAHRHLIPISGSGEVNGRYYEILPFVEGPTLSEFLQDKRRLTDSEARQLVRQLAEAIHYLHGEQVLHRDIKPTNIFVTAAAPLEVALSDFGSARFTSYQTMLTGTVGTVAYAAPEAVTGLYSEASDYWSLGIVLLEALSGRQPWEGTDLRHQIYRVASGNVEIPEGLSEEWKALFRGLLEPDYTQRWRKREIDTWLQSPSNVQRPPVKTVPASRTVRRKAERQPELTRLDRGEALDIAFDAGLETLAGFFWIGLIVYGVTRNSLLALLSLVLVVVIGIANELRPRVLERRRRKERAEAQLRTLPKERRRKIRKIIRKWHQDSDQ